MIPRRQESELPASFWKIMSEPETDSDSDYGSKSPHLPPSKRRRIIDPSAVTTVPIYSNKVSTSLQLKPSILPDSSVSEDAGELPLWPESQTAPRAETKSITVALSDSEEEPEENGVPETIHSPSPPPPPRRHIAKTTRRANQKIKEINRKLNAIDSLLSPAHEFGASGDHRNGSGNHDDDDIIVVSDESPVLARNRESRDIQLKFRCRANLYKIPMQ
ncbi:hypothetical protein Z043_113155, partial [Scleropages formosus]